MCKLTHGTARDVNVTGRRPDETGRFEISRRITWRHAASAAGPYATVQPVHCRVSRWYIGGSRNSTVQQTTCKNQT